MIDRLALEKAAARHVEPEHKSTIGFSSRETKGGRERSSAAFFAGSIGPMFPTEAEQMQGTATSRVYLVDRDGIVTYCSPGMAALAGFVAAEQLVGRPSLDLYVADAGPRFLERRQHAWAGKEIESSLRTTLLRADGSRVPVEITVSTLRVDNESAGRLTFVRPLST